MKKEDIKINIEKYCSKIDNQSRWASFDYCYNYFYENRGQQLVDDIEKSCSVLGFYLASWGMFRGKSYLSQNSLAIYKPVIEYISDLDNSVWEIDVDNYNEKSIDEIINIYKKIKIKIGIKKTHLTLVTKILLGVFGFIPAFDTNFCNGFREIHKEKKQCGFTRVNKKSLLLIKDFYDSNNELIIDLQNKLFTTDFITGEKTSIKYTKAKIIDMYGFELGKKLN
ncbi:hypothetical protein [Flavobacterium sp.]|uniref:hypothetical protein n=1 Tax=Flavobacterium sp. TaxID=239 RepID=UPI0037C090D3